MMKLNSQLHFFFTLPVCFVFVIMYGVDINSLNNEKITIKYLDTSVSSRDLATLITIRDALNDPVFDKSLRKALRDNKITVNEMTELRGLADKSVRHRQDKTE